MPPKAARASPRSTPRTARPDPIPGRDLHDRPVRRLHLRRRRRPDHPDRGRPGQPLSRLDADSCRAAVLRAKADGARVIVLAAEGRFFSVGGDLERVRGAPTPRAHSCSSSPSRPTGSSPSWSAATPIVVSVVHGTAAGIGFPLAAAADIVLAAENAKFSLAYAKVGLSPDGGGSLLVHTLGLHRVLRLALLGDVLTAQEAARRRTGRARRTGRRPRERRPTVSSPSSSPAPRAPSRRPSGWCATPPSRLPRPRSAARPSRSATLAGSPNGREGVAAFLEKRPPRYS